MQRNNLTALAILTLACFAGTTFGQAVTDVKTAEKTRYNGAVAIWYGSHFEDSVAHDWEPIKEWNGPFHPELGEYKTDDPKIIKQHLKWLRRAGVDVIFYDVCRIQPELTLFDLPKQKTLQLLVEELSHQEKETRKLKLVVWIEKWNSNPTAEQYRFGLDYIRKNLANHDFYFQFAGKPLVMTYLNTPVPDFSQIEKEYEPFFTMRRIAAFSSPKFWAYLGPSGDKECMTANPGADGYMEMAYITKYVNKQPIDLKTLQEHGKSVIEQRADGKVFEEQLLKARQVDPSVIFISGWNDWAFCLQMEPAKEYGFKYVDLAARMLGREEETLPYREP